MQPFTGDDAHIAALTAAYAVLVALLHEVGAVDRRELADALRRLAASSEQQRAVAVDLTRLAAAVERGGPSGQPV